LPVVEQAVVQQVLGAVKVAAALVVIVLQLVFLL